MTLAERMKDWIHEVIEDVLESFNETMSNILGWGVTKFLDLIEPDLIEKARPQLEEIRDTPGMPDNIRNLIDDLLSGTSAVSGMLIGILAGTAMGGPLAAAMEPIMNNIKYTVYNQVASARMDPFYIIPAAFRNPDFEHLVDEDLKDQGYLPERIAAFKQAMGTVLSFIEIRDLYHRGKLSLKDAGIRLKALGYSEDDLSHLEELFSSIPPLADMVRFADFSAFDPDVIAAFRDFYDAPGYLVDAFKLLGMINMTDEPGKDWVNKYYFSHWIQPGRYELGEMHRRGVLGVSKFDPGYGPGDEEADEALKLAYKTMAYSGYWQDKLLELVKEVPTRVDIRRWWDMRTITEDRMRELYHAQGYYGDDLEDYILWTKVYVAWPDLLARFKNGWITEDEVRTTLIDLGMPEDRVEEMMQTKVKAAKPERTAGERELTKTDIVMWVKDKPTARWNQGIELLGDLGYDSAEADMILTARVELASSPETFDDYRKITEKWRQSVGAGPREITENLRRRAEELVKAKDQVAVLRESLKAEEAQLIDEEVLPEEATAHRDELRIALHRAEAELFRIQTEYDTLRAEWEHIAR